VNTSQKRSRTCTKRCARAWRDRVDDRSSLQEIRDSLGVTAGARLPGLWTKLSASARFGGE